MPIFAGLDVSDKSTSVCVVDDSGAIVWQGSCATDPQVLADTLARRCPGVARVVLETGALSAFLYHGLIERGVPVICICARHAKGVLSVRANKSDSHDAEGLAQLARTGWFKAVHIKDNDTHLDRAQLKVREQMVKAHRAMLSQLRGLLKLFGLRLGTATTPARRAARLACLFEQKPELEPILAPLVISGTQYRISGSYGPDCFSRPQRRRLTGEASRARPGAALRRTCRPPPSICPA